MADVKSTLTETLRAHRETNIEPLRNGDYRISCDGCSWRSDEESAVAACDAHDGHLADVLLGLSGVAVTLKNRCRCGCGESREDHLCPCGCGHTYEEAVRNVMGGPMFLSWDQAEANIDEHPDVPCKWPAAAGVFSEGATND